MANQTIIDYLASKGFTANNTSGDEHIYNCIFCEKKRHLYINPKKNVYHCKSCNNSGNYTDIINHFGDDPKSSIFNKPLKIVKKVTPPQKLIPSATIHNLEKKSKTNAVEYLSKIRFINNDIIEKFKDQFYYEKNRIVFPIYKNNQIISLSKKSITGYKPLYEKGYKMTGGHWPNITANKNKCALVESCINALTLYQFVFYTNQYVILSALDSTNKPEILNKFTEIDIFIDNDLHNKSLKWAEGIKNKYPNKTIRYLVWPDNMPKNGYDINDLAKQSKDNTVLLDKLKSLEFKIIGDDIEDTIIIKGGRLPWIVDNSERILLQKEPHCIFQRNGQVVKISKLDKKQDKEGVSRDAGSLVISEIDHHYLSDLFGRYVNFKKLTIKNIPYPVNPPQQIALTYLSRTNEWNLPILNRTITCPTLRKDGSILDQPGYDEKTGLYFDPGNTKFLKVSSKPSKDEAIEALKILKEPFKYFPFVNDEDYSVTLAAILTAIIRPSLKSSPMFAFSAPTMGSGKSLLAESIALIATGKLPASINQAKKEEENPKRLLSILMAGDPILLIDNCEYPIKGANLCTILTQEYYQDRLLGQNKQMVVDTKITILTTGNNLQFMGDMTTRALLCTIDAGLERPEERQFKINLYDYIPKHRPKLIKAALTILKAYVMEGRPRQNIAPYGRFEEWSDLVRSALIWLNQEDPCKTREKIDRNDPVQEQLKGLLTAWWDCFEDMSFTIKEMILECKRNPEDEQFKILYENFRDIAGKNEDIDTRNLGNYLRKIEKRLIEKKCIQVDTNFNRKPKKWKIEKK